MSAASDLRNAGASRVLEPHDDGYTDAIAGFDLGVACAPDVVVDAQTPAGVTLRSHKNCPTFTEIGISHPPRIEPDGTGAGV